MTAKNLFGILAVSSLVLASCKKELQPQDSASVTDTLPKTETAAATPQVPAMTPAAVPMPQNTVAPNKAVSMTPTPAAKGMNPAHGQPGHRCDIAVGAPLNSPPGKTPQANPNQVVKMNPTVNSTGKATIVPTTAPAASGTPAILNAPATATAPGMNPPHGQEGHRCDIAVGQPLPKS